MFAPIAEKIANLAAKNPDEKNSKLPASITPYANVLALSIVHATQEAIDENSTKPLTAWKNKWCEKNANGEFVLKDFTAAEKLSAAIDVYEKYVNILSERSLFDYDDMILSVIQACESHPELRANLQEQFQFIMVDEFQDTNLAQLRLLFNLTSENDDNPNIMAVGDDDQAIFSFQGADAGNIQRFRQHYHDPKIIVLTDNYRSAENILSSARDVITQGADRLENTIDGLSKQLTAHANSEGSKVEIQEFSSVSEERAGIAKQIAELIKNGEKPENITIIARHHKELIEILPHLYKENLFVNYERHDDILEQDIIQILDKLARTVVAISQNNLDIANSLLPEITAHPAFGFSALDIWKLSLQAYKNRQLWLESMLANSVFKEFAEWLLERAKDVPNLPLEEQLDNLLGLTNDVVIFLLAGALVYVREYRDAWFISVVIVVNSTIGIIQELRAKRVLRQLELMSAPKARLLKDGNVVEVGYDELKIGDEILIQAGDELPADAKVIESKGLELNESMLTGESASIEKKDGDVVLAATTVLAGEGTARVIAIGDDTKAGAISQVLKRYKPELTPLQLAIWRAIYFLTYGAI
jgi:ATP-dependent exoDNAse (exonuclease V) beta subunit